jgi:hypothetical protein
MHPLLNLEHFDLDDLIELARRANYRRERQWIDVGGESDATTYGSG